VGFAEFYHLPSLWLMRCSPGMAARNLIRLKATTQADGSQTILTSSRFIRLLLLCVVLGVWPLLATLLSIFFPMRSDIVDPWPGWDAVHKHFYEIPVVPFRFMTGAALRTILRVLWYEILSGFIIFFAFVFTEDVRGDLNRFWVFVKHRIPFVHRCKAILPSSRSHANGASGHGSDDVTLVAGHGASDVEAHIGMFPRPGESIRSKKG
jgi:hypothetical protein